MNLANISITDLTNVDVKAIAYALAHEANPVATAALNGWHNDAIAQRGIDELDTLPDEVVAFIREVAQIGCGARAFAQHCGGMITAGAAATINEIVYERGAILDSGINAATENVFCD